MIIFNHTNDIGWWQSLVKMLANVNNSFSWTSLLLILLEILLLALGYIFEENR